MSQSSKHVMSFLHSIRHFILTIVSESLLHERPAQLLSNLMVDCNDCMMFAPGYVR